ncbi:Aldo/keto reductase [Trichoderma sp. SZMC 28014]
MPPFAQPVTPVFGGTRIGNREQFMPHTHLETFLKTLTRHHITKIDTAQAYGSSEATLGRVQAGSRFVIDTKWSPPSWTESSIPWATSERIIRSAEESINKLAVDQVDIFYLHRPDPMTPISETLAAVNAIHKRGVFLRFGLSGFPATEIEAIYNHCADHSYPLPVVYQGSYNPLNRHKETALLLTLRRLRISFYAYGTLAGGFLGKTAAQAREMADNGAHVSATCRPYLRDAYFLEILAQWNTIAETEGVSPAELTYRWVAHHSALRSDHGDAFIIGASSPEQLDETLSGIEKGPLSETACSSIQEIWEKVKGV